VGNTRLMFQSKSNSMIQELVVVQDLEAAVGVEAVVAIVVVADKATMVIDHVDQMQGLKLSQMWTMSSTFPVLHRFDVQSSSFVWGLTLSSAVLIRVNWCQSTNKLFLCRKLEMQC
jgi:hypothetical protein